MIKNSAANRIQIPMALLLAVCVCGCGAQESAVSQGSNVGTETAVWEDGAAEAAVLQRDDVGKDAAHESHVEEESAVQESGAPADAGLAGSTAAETGSQAAETNGTGLDTDVFLYGCSPVSEDLSALPAMDNRVYAEWEGNIYYRQYSDEDVEEGALWGDFAGIPDTAKELMCMEPDGSVTQVGVDYGHGAFFIVNGRIYSQKYKKMREDGQQTTFTVVYSCALDGSDVREYSAQEVLAVRGDKIICGTGGYGEGYGDVGYGMAWIDGRDGQEHVLIPENDSYHGAEYLGATEEEVFLYKLVENDLEEYGQPYDVTLYSIDYQGEKMDLATITLQEYAAECVSEEFLLTTTPSPLFISCLQIMGDDLYFSVGTTNGTAHVYSGGMIYSVKKDGSGLTLLVDESITERFYLYDDGVNRLLYGKLGDEETRWVVDGMQPIVLQGEAVEDIVPRDAEQAYYDQPHGYVTGDGADAVLFYPDSSGVCYALLTPKESEALGIRTHENGHLMQQITDIEYLCGKLFFTVTDLAYSEEYSIGWRDGYERGGSVCYCKDMESGKIDALYEY